MFAFAAAVAVFALITVPLLEIPPAKEEVIELDDVPAKPEAADATVSETRAHEPKGIGKYVQLSVVPLASVLFLVYIGYAGVLSFVAGYAESRGLGDAVSLYFVVYAAVIFISRPPVGRRKVPRG